MGGLVKVREKNATVDFRCARKVFAYIISTHKSIGEFGKMQPLTQQVWVRAQDSAFLTCSWVL